jgi:addiction module HigA family antidote
MSNKIYANDIVLKDNFHPGEFLKDEIEGRSMKQRELAEKIKIAKNVLSEIIHGKRNLTPMLALKLEEALGINAEFWMKLQVNYEINLIRNQYKSLVDKTKASVSKRAKLNTAVSKSQVAFSSKQRAVKVKKSQKLSVKKK